MNDRNDTRKKTWMAVAILSAAAMAAVSGCQSRSSTTSSQTSVADASQEESSGDAGSISIANGSDSSKETENSQRPSENTDQKTLCFTSVPKYRSEWKEERQLFNGYVDQLYLMADGHEALKEALKTFNQNQEQQLEEMYQDNKEFLNSDQFEDSALFSYQVSVIPKRADEQIVSLSVEEYDYLGGAHPNSMVTSYNLNPQTGKTYTLKDLAQDYDGIFEYVKKKLKEDYSPDMFFEGYEDTVKSMFYGNTETAKDTADSLGLSDDEMLSWTVDKNGVTIVFNNYDLAPYAAGRQVVEIPFNEEGALFKKEFIPGTSDASSNAADATAFGSVQPLYNDQEVSIDLNGDGEKETLTVSATTDFETGQTSFFAETAGASAFLFSETEELTSDSGDIGCWLIQTSDHRSYLYIETKEENDFRNIHVFDLSKKGITYCGVSEDSFYGSVMTNPDDFILFRRSDMLSTYSIFRHYRIGEDGMPQPLSDDFTVSGTYLEEEMVPTLTTKREVPVWIDGKQEMLPEGTALKLKKTDDSTYVEAEKKDGQICQIRIDQAEEDVYPRTIDGISVEDCFDGMQYAG